MKIVPITIKLFSIYKNLKNAPVFKAKNSDNPICPDSFEYSKKQSVYNTISDQNNCFTYLKEYAGQSKFDEESKALALDILSLVQKGELPFNILRGWDDAYYDETFKKNAKLYFSALKSGTKKEDMKKLFIPCYNSIDEGMKKTAAGDLFEINDSVYLKMNERQKYKLKISADAYLNLFPPINFYSQSPKIGDCYFLCAISSMWDSPFYKAYVLNCFSETDDGKLAVRFPRGTKQIVTDLDGNLPEDKAENQEYYVKGSKGIKLLESLYEDELCSTKTATIANLIMSYIAKIACDDLESTINEKMAKKMEEVYRSVTQGNTIDDPEYVLSDIRYDVECQLELKDKSDTYFVYKFEDMQKQYKNNPLVCTKNPTLFYRSDNGNVIDAYKIFGLSGYLRHDGSEIPHKLILTPKLLDSITEMNNGFYLFSASIKNFEGMSEFEPINKEKGLIGGHAYSLKIEQNSQTREYEYILTNPYNSSKKVKLTKEEMLLYVKSIGIAHQKIN